MGLGAKQHPIHRLGVCRIGEDAQRDVGSAVWSIERQLFYWLAHTGNHVVAPGRGEAGGYHAANAAQPDDCDIQGLCRLHCRPD